MKAINLGDNTYDIFDDAMKVYSELPAQSYVVRCSKTRGFDCRFGKKVHAEFSRRGIISA